MDLQSIFIIVSLIALLAGLAVFTFKTKSDCGTCQSVCRKDLYTEINKKADKEDMKKLEGHYLTIITEIAKLQTIISMTNKGG